MRVRLHLAVAVCLALGALAAGCNCGRTAGITTNHPVVRVEAPDYDFGPVPEFTTVQGAIVVQNLGVVPLTVGAAREPGGSDDFVIDTPLLEVPAQASGEVKVTFSPKGKGSDQSGVLLSTDDPDQPEVHATVRGGPIWPRLAFDPDPLDFRPASQPLVTRPAAIKNVGLASLTVTAVGVDVTGNPDFSVTPPALPVTLAPSTSQAVDVAYARSTRTASGFMEVLSDDLDASVRKLELIPDPPAACGDGLDNDSDGLVDFPDDPGCADSSDDDEYNPPQCINGATQPCGTSQGICTQGVRACANSIWGGCDGGVRPGLESCNGQDDDCNGVTDDGVSETCSVFGCGGARACLADAGVDGGQWTACLPVGASPEVCDGLDNNCNGSADEGVVLTCTVFSCQGLQVCIPDAGGQFTSCVPSNPLTESCNGADDDCNGQVDDAIPDLACGLGQCRRTAPACVDGGMGSCMPGSPTAEVCNGADDNCNGSIDDGLAPLTCGVGACYRSVAACVLGDAGVCAPGAPSAESCNNIDDDCNGSTDDGLGSLNCGVGECARSVAACTSGVPGTCSPGAPVGEVCNLKDDNCNSLIDDLPALTCGVGACARTAAACVDGGVGTCTPGVGSAEICDNIDNDCNGVVDGITQPCYLGPPLTRNVGRCTDGTQTCTAGLWGASCPGQVLPAASENCGNSIDDDCNGPVNDGCDAGPCDINGVWRVDGGAIGYSCAFGLVNISITQVNMATNVPSAGTMTVVPQFTWSPGSGNLLRAANATCPSGAMNVSVLYAGTCNETYRLQGSFTGPNSFNGTFTMSYSGTCFGCTNQSFPVQLVR